MRERILPFIGILNLLLLTIKEQEKMTSRTIERTSKNYVARYTIRERVIDGRTNIHVRCVLMGRGRKVVKNNSFYR